jgi:hypothetical protein
MTCHRVVSLCRWRSSWRDSHPRRIPMRDTSILSRIIPCFCLRMLRHSIHHYNIYIYVYTLYIYHNVYIILRKVWQSMTWVVWKQTKSTVFIQSEPLCHQLCWGEWSICFMFFSCSLWDIWHTQLDRVENHGYWSIINFEPCSCHDQLL